MAFVVGNKLVVYCKSRISKTNGQDYPKGYFEIGGNLYRVDVNKNPNTKKDGVGAILSITQTQKQSNNFGNQGGFRGGGGFGNNRGGGRF